MSLYQFTAPCLMGIEKLLSTELKYMGAENVKADNGRVFFEGNENMLARANIRSRFAERILLLAGTADVYSFEDLFQGVISIPWEKYIPVDGQFPVKGSCLNSKLHSVPDCQAIIKKAVAERLKSVYNRNWFEETGAFYRIQFLILKNKAALMIDTSGETLHKRGYRAASGDAPIRETLAASMAELARVRSSHIVIDPFCGSGTILIEAARKALNIPANADRRFISENWSFIEPNIWENERICAKKDIITDSCFHAFGYDIDDSVLSVARSNAEIAGVSDYITFKKRDIRDFSENFERLSVICNPPYGERLLDIEEAEKLYKIMGEKFIPLKGRSYTVISPDDDFELCFGRPADKRRKLYNGMIKCHVYQFFK